MAVARSALRGAAALVLLWPLQPPSGAFGRGPANAVTLSAASMPLQADFGTARPSADARAVADWIAGIDDNDGAAVVIVDKKAATLHVFDGRLRLVASSPVLLGAALGDDTTPGIGDRPLPLVRPEEKTTPAGRFVAERGRNARGEDVVWVDYDAAVSMHRVITHNPAERRLERLASPDVREHRISYGCINVPVAFYDAYIRPTFARRAGLVYVLPDVATVHQVFGFEPGLPATRARFARAH